ncbi:P-loop ATPase, Sll1717 family [Oceanirhabdus seepicola]|uniref:FunZ protein n=1 Tax=Oceanirhabdus seepicola TaxID=2828781 RepID=A0A9J6NYL0_9CLOT|nr:hypothetical protein [Oceanirhabdus seepicola]MCM1989062.1 hypothetical protein [Oceanirhabdus seepicola]
MDNEGTPHVKLKDLYIGEVDGKKEASKSNFLDYFYKGHPAVKKSQKNDIYFIFGRKGTGKTILAYFLKKQYSDKDYICKIIDAHEFELNYLTELYSATLEYDQYYLFWKWNILLHIAETLIEQHRVRKMIPFSKVGRIRKVMKSRYSTTKGYKQDGFSIQRTNELGTTMKSVMMNSPFEGMFNSAKKTTVGRKFTKTKYYEEIKTFEKYIKKALKNNSKFLIIYDDLDELKIAADKEGNINIKLIEKIFSVIRDINIMINKSCKNNGSKVMLLFRNDLLDMINSHSHNLNRIVSDSQAILDWHYNCDKRPYDDPLMDLILHKMKLSNELLKELSTKEIYEKYFSNKVDGISVVRYLKRYSFGKPRDFIKYLNIIKEQYPEKDKFVSHTFKKCERKFSEYFYSELINELSISENSEFVKESLLLIRNFKKSSFRYDDINRYFMDNIETYKNIRSCKEALRFMYKKGVLGNSWIYKKNKRGKEIYHFSWAFRNDSSPEPNYTQAFTVHKAIHKKFSM